MRWKCWGEHQERAQPCDLVWREDLITPRLQPCLPMVPKMHRRMNIAFMWITAEGNKQVMRILCLCGTYLVSFSTGHCIMSLCTGLNQITAEHPHPAFHSCSLALAHNQGFLPTQLSKTATSVSCSNSHLFIHIYHHTYQALCFYMFLFSHFFFLLKLHCLSCFSEDLLQNWGLFYPFGVQEQLCYFHIKLQIGNVKCNQLHLKHNQPADRTIE